MAQTREQAREQGREIAPIDRLASSRLPITKAMMERIGVDEASWRVLTDQIFPEARTVDGIKLAVDYCRSRNLDIMKKPVHIVPVYSSALKRMVERIWPGIAEIRTTASRTREYAGITDAEFGPPVEREFERQIKDDRDPRNDRIEKHTVTYPEWCRVVVHRFVKGEKCAFSAKVFWTEIYATVDRWSDCPNEMWRKRPYGQIEKCTEAAALRKAFPEELGSQYAAEEMEGKVIEGEIVANAPASKAVLSQTAAPAQREGEKPPGGPKPPGDQDGPDGTAENVTNEPGKSNVIDAETDEIDAPGAAADDEAPFDFEEMAARFGEAPDEKTLETIWADMELEKLFEGKEDDLLIAIKAKNNRRRQIREAAARAT